MDAPSENAAKIVLSLVLIMAADILYATYYGCGFIFGQTVCGEASVGALLILLFSLLLFEFPKHKENVDLPQLSPEDDIFRQQLKEVIDYVGAYKDSDDIRNRVVSILSGSEEFSMTALDEFDTKQVLNVCFYINYLHRFSDVARSNAMIFINCFQDIEIASKMLDVLSK